MKLFNIHDTDKFYKTIDACKKPVVMTASDGTAVDFRNNTLIREVLDTAFHGDIPEIELRTSCPEDAHRLLNFVMYGFNFSDFESEKKSA